MAKKRGLNNTIVLEAAAILAEECGLEQLTIQSLADRLLVRPASLYNHITGLEEVRRYIARLSMEQLSTAIRESTCRLPRHEALEQAAASYRAFAKARPELYKAFIGSAALDDFRMDEGRQTVVQVLGGFLEPWRGTREERVHFLRGFRSALHGFISLEAAGFFKRGTDIEESFRQMVQSFIVLLESYTVQPADGPA